MSPSTSPRRWYHWFHPDDTHEERKLIWKLDLLVVGYAFIVYWVSRKYFGKENGWKQFAARETERSGLQLA